MIKVDKVNVKITAHNQELGNSRLDFKISGNNINYIIANTMRREIFSDVPIYAFNEFKFDKNTSVFHNNYLKLRLRHMPVWGIENKVEFIDYNIKTNNDGLDDIQENNEEAEDDNIELNVEKNLNTSNLKQFTMYVSVKNNSNDIITVSTAQANFYYDETKICMRAQIN